MLRYIKNIGKKFNRISPLSIVISIALFSLLFLGFGRGLDYLSSMSDEESLSIVKQSVVRSAVQCYALEGQYPKNINYLKENYGLFVDEENYFIDYIYIGSNLLPDITVITLDELNEKE